MLTKEQMRRVAAMRRTYGENEGSCFGVTDPAELRDTRYRAPQRMEYEFREGQKLYRILETTPIVGLADLSDVVLNAEYRVRITVEPISSSRRFDDWSKTLIPYSDIPTK